LLRPARRRLAALAALAVPAGVLGGGAVTAGAAPVGVVIEHYAFAPAQLSVTVGDTVTWTNNDTAGHDVTSIGGGPLKSPLLAKGQSYSLTFATAGTFRYTCTVHPDMVATVAVKAAATTTSAAPAKPTTGAPGTAPPPTKSAPTSTVAATAAPTSTVAATAAPTSTVAATNVAAAVGPVGATGVALTTDGGGSRLNPLLFIAAVVVAVVVGATIAVLEPARRRRGGP
jgi:plastocyanin